MSSTNWLKDVEYGAVASTSSGLVSIPPREVGPSLGGRLLVEEGLDVGDVTDVPLAQERVC